MIVRTKTLTELLLKQVNAPEHNLFEAIISKHHLVSVQPPNVNRITVRTGGVVGATVGPRTPGHEIAVGKVFVLGIVYFSNGIIHCFYFKLGLGCFEAEASRRDASRKP